MKQGRSIQDLAVEITRQRDTKKDYLADTRNLTMVAEDMTASPNGPVLAIRDMHSYLGINNLTHGQIASYTGVPKKYYDRMLVECPDLLASNVNTWFHRKEEPRLVRTLDNRARAFLSNGYRCLDNDQFIEAALPPLMDFGVEVMSCEVTDTKLYLKVVDKRIKRDLKKGVQLGVGHDRFDTVSPALVLSNSEVGEGALSIMTSVWTGGCSNLMVISERSQRKYHLGAKMDLGEEMYKLLSDKTRALTDAALWGQIRDVCMAAFEQAQFDAIVDKLAETTTREIKDPIATLDVTTKAYDLNDMERVSILNHLIRGGDLSQYGLHAAITRTAEEVADYDRASELERLGGRIIELPANEWANVYAKAA